MEETLIYDRVENSHGKAFVSDMNDTKCPEKSKMAKVDGVQLKEN